MKTLLLLLLSIPIYSQIGIGTTAPTQTLDVNGITRVRSLTDGTLQSNSQGVISQAPYKSIAMAVADINGNIFKSFGIASITRINTTTYRVLFSLPQPNNNYIINFSARQRLLSYDNTTINGFDIIVNSNPNQVTNFDFNFTVFTIF